MFFLRGPDDELVRTLLRSRRDLEFAYEPVGATREGLIAAPAGFTLDRYGVRLGQGQDVWRRGKEALRRLQNYPPSLTRVVWEGEPAAHQGALFAAVISHFGFYSVLPCRVIYVIDHPGRFAVGFGTLPGHSELGEECFSLTRSGEDAVHYDVLAFSRTLGLARLGHPVARGLQRRFQRETVERMKSIARG